MGEFITPNEIVADKPVGTEIPRVFTQQFFESVIQKAIDDGEIPADHRIAFIAAADESGAKAIVAVNLINRETMKFKINGVFEHEWHGDNKAGARVIFSFK